MIADVHRLENAARLAMGHIPLAPHAPAARDIPASIIVGIAGFVAAALGMLLFLV